MSRTTVLLVGLMLVGLIVSPALAQTTVTFRDQHIGPDYTDPAGQDPTMSNFSHLIQYNMFLGDYSYWKKDTYHQDQYDAWGMVPANGNIYAPLMDYDTMIGSATDTYDDGAGTISYVGQVPHGAVIHSAVITLMRTNYGVDMVNIGVRQVLDPDKLGHWGVNPAGGGWQLGAGWLTRDSLVNPNIGWDSAGTATFTDVLGTAESTIASWYGGTGMITGDWTMTNMAQNWADCLNSRQGFAMTSDSGGGEILGGKNGYAARPTLVISFTASLVGDANKDDEVGLIDLGALAANYGSTLASWQEGDFNGDGEVGLIDLGALAAHYGEGAGGPVPEPMTMTLLGLGALALIRRRK